MLTIHPSGSSVLVNAYPTNVMNNTNKKAQEHSKEPTVSVNTEVGKQPQKRPDPIELEDTDIDDVDDADETVKE